jgi:predicted transcriptional regulator
MILLFHNPVISQENNPSILIIYSIAQERNVVETIIKSNFPNVINSSVSFVNFNDSLLENKDVLIILGTMNFTLSTENQTSIFNFANQDKKSLLVFTPYIGQFTTSLTDILGIDDINATYPSGVDPEFWNLDLNTSLGNLDIGYNVSYSGKFGVFDKDPSSETIAIISNSSSAIPAIQQLSYPLPAIINSSSSNSQIITGSISVIPVFSSGLKLNQIPIFEDLISEIIMSAINFHNVINLPVTTSDSSIISSSDTTSQTESTSISSSITPNPQDSPKFENFWYLLILGIIALIIIFRSRILGFLHWFQERTLGIFIGIIGSVYKVRERILDTNQVLINQNRSRILDYLEFLAGSGAHFREIKSAINLGTGILLWHLQVLEEFGLITQYRVGRYNIFVAYEFNEEFNLEQKKLEIKFRSKYAEVIFENLMNIEETDKLNISEFAKRSSVDRKTTKKHLKILEEENIIKLDKTSYGVEIVKINKTKIEKLLKSLRLKDQYMN